MLEVKDSNEIRTYSCPKCYLCGNEGKLLYQSLKDRLFGAPGEWNLKKCINPECGLVWLDPMPLEEDIVKAYLNYFTHEIQDLQISLLGRLLRTVYRALKTIPSHLVGLRAEEVQIESMCLSNVSPGKLLDIGCGSGQFLQQMQLYGWEVEGVDFDSKAVEGVKTRYDLNVHAGSLESIAYPDSSFDAITMSHVIEHMPDPIALLKESYRLLKPGGYLVVTTPNVNSWGHKQFEENWLHLDPPRHLHLFSQNTLRHCADRAGLDGKIDTWTAAANSIDGFIGSFNIQESGYYVLKEPNKLFFLRSLISQYYEFFLNKKYADVGEVIILLCSKL
jgi:2-polyprenyl-3-methyl-5-hydroxy-6-metoxy-1,4-benzoquinol methylase